MIVTIFYFIVNPTIIISIMVNCLLSLSLTLSLLSSCDTPTRGTGGSEDGRSMPRLGDVGRSDSGEVEMTDFQRPGPSSEEPAGTQAGVTCCATA